MLPSLAQLVGNRGMQALVARDAEAVDTLTPAMADQLARRLFDAMDGWGTDEEAIYGALGGRTQGQVDAVEVSYRRLFDRSLQADLQDELNAGELRHLASLAPSQGSTADDELGTEADRVNRAEPAARQLRAAMEGWGTDESAIFAVLTGRSAGERDAITASYAALFHRNLADDLRDELSGSELQEAMRLLGAGELHPADELYQAMAGAGTDEARVHRVLAAVAGNAGAISDLLHTYASRYGGLVHDLHDDLSGEDLASARRALGEPGHHEAIRAVLGGNDPDLLHHVPDFTIVEVATRLALVRRVHTETVVGPSDEAVLERIWTSADMDREAALHQPLYQHSRDRGAELPAELTTFGQFRNYFEQDMFEGATTAATGIYDWILVDDRLRVNIPINFVAVDGATIPWAKWRGEIDAVWNQFAAVGADGRKVPIELKLVNDSSAERTVRVVKNTGPGGTWVPADRANAGKFFENHGDAYTVPHEVGHFIGLQDEYQRTHDEFEEVVDAPAHVGPPNNSGKTEQEIADRLHELLHEDVTPTVRATRVRGHLTGVGLMVANEPQQGDFAQAVMAAYDASHGTLKDDIIDQLTDDSVRTEDWSRWLVQSTFSYATASIMGSANIFNAPPHAHAVEARHLRNFVDIVARRFPETTWTSGPR